MISHIQGNHGGTTSPVQSLPVAFGSPVGAGNLITVFYGLNNVTGTITDDKGNVYTYLPVDFIGGTYGAQVAYCLNVTNGPTTITLTQSATASYPFLIIDEFSGLSAYDTTSAGSYYPSSVGSFFSGNVTPANAGELLYTVGWAGNGGPLTVNSPFNFIQDGTIAGSVFNNVAVGSYVQPASAPIGATWNPPNADIGMSRIVAFKATAPSPPRAVIQMMATN